ncbi:hypothetical protein ACIPSA_03105 [Streptomyces sp. NPDC086549]
MQGGTGRLGGSGARAVSMAVEGEPSAGAAVEAVDPPSLTAVTF